MPPSNEQQQISSARPPAISGKIVNAPLARILPPGEDKMPPRRNLIATGTTMGLRTAQLTNPKDSAVTHDLCCPAANPADLLSSDTRGRTERRFCLGSGYAKAVTNSESSDKPPQYGDSVSCVPSAAIEGQGFDETTVFAHLVCAAPRRNDLCHCWA